MQSWPPARPAPKTHLEEAYGHPGPTRRQVVPRTRIPPHIPLDIGTHLQLSLPDGKDMLVVAEVTDEKVVMDANHPLAGKALTFNVEMIEIV